MFPANLAIAGHGAGGSAPASPCHDGDDVEGELGTCPLATGIDRTVVPHLLLPVGDAQDAPAAIAIHTSFTLVVRQPTPPRRAPPPRAASVPLFLLHRHLLT